MEFNNLNQNKDRKMLSTSSPNAIILGFFCQKKPNYVRALTQEGCRGCSGNDERITTEFDPTGILIQHQFLSNNVTQEMSFTLHTGGTVSFIRSIELCNHRCLNFSESFRSWICYFSISDGLQHKQVVMAEIKNSSYQRWALDPHISAVKAP